MALIVLFIICCVLWSLVCPLYDYDERVEEQGEEQGGFIRFEHLLFSKTIKGNVYPPAKNDFTGRWEGDRLFLTFQSGGQPSPGWQGKIPLPAGTDRLKWEEASIVDDTIVFRGKTFTGGRFYFNVPFWPGF